MKPHRMKRRSLGTHQLFIGLRSSRSSLKGLIDNATKPMKLVGQEQPGGKGSIHPLIPQSRLLNCHVVNWGLKLTHYSLPTFTDGLMFNSDRTTDTVNVTPEGANRIHPLYPKKIRIGNARLCPCRTRKTSVREYRRHTGFRTNSFCAAVTAHSPNGSATLTEFLRTAPSRFWENYQNVIVPGGGALFQSLMACSTRFPLRRFPALLTSCAYSGMGPAAQR